MHKIEINYFAILVVLVIISLNADAVIAGERVKKIIFQGAIKESPQHVVTIAELEKLNQTEYIVFNPYRKKKNRYKGVLMKDIVKEFGVPGVTRIDIVAADGYQSQFTQKEWQKWDILFALRVNGELIGPDKNGPMKVVMPYDTSPGMDKVYYEPKWIWAVKKILFTQ